MHQRLLEAARERVAAVEDCPVVPSEAPWSAPGACFGVATGNFGDDAGGLGVGVAEADDLDRIAAWFAREQGFAETRGILRDDGVGGAENVAGRPEVLLEAVHPRHGKIPFEPPYLTYTRPAPPIPPLVTR